MHHSLHRSVIYRFSSLLPFARIFRFSPPARLFGSTGIGFVPLSAHDRQILEWSKQQEIERRKRAVAEKSEKIWAALLKSPEAKKNPPQWAKMAKSEYSQLWHHYQGDYPSEWELNYFYQFSLEKHSPWRWFEIEKEFSQQLEKAIESLLKEIRQELKELSGGETTLEISRKDFVERLRKALGREPNGREVKIALEAAEPLEFRGVIFSM